MAELRSGSAVTFKRAAGSEVLITCPAELARFGCAIILGLLDSLLFLLSN